LTDDELRQLALLLPRYVAHDLDQFEHWRVESPKGPAFVEIIRAAHVGHCQVIWPLPEHLTTDT
jgi:hypothetical protein